MRFIDLNFKISGNLSFRCWRRELVAISIYLPLSKVKSARNWKKASTQFYRFWALRFPRKRPFYRR